MRRLKDEAQGSQCSALTQSCAQQGGTHRDIAEAASGGGEETGTVGSDAEGTARRPCTPSAFFQSRDVVPAPSLGAGGALGVDPWRPCLKTRILPPRDGKLPVQRPAE